MKNTDNKTATPLIGFRIIKNGKRYDVRARNEKEATKLFKKLISMDQKQHERN